MCARTVADSTGCSKILKNIEISVEAAIKERYFKKAAASDMSGVS